MLIIDRFEGEWAVIELGQNTFSIPRLLIPRDAKEGDIINIHITINKKTTEKQKQSINKFAEKLFKE